MYGALMGRSHWGRVPDQVVESATVVIAHVVRGIQTRQYGMQTT